MKYEIINPDADDKAVYINKTVNELASLFYKEQPQTDQELAERFEEYFQYCAQTGTTPLLEKMALFVGIPYIKLEDWRTGKKLGTGPRCQEICTKAKDICYAFEAQAAMDNKINPVVYIYRSKAHFGYKDNPDVVLAVSNDQRSKDEILAEAKALEDI